MQSIEKYSFISQGDIKYLSVWNCLKKICHVPISGGCKAQIGTFLMIDIKHLASKMTDYLANLPELIVSAVTKLLFMINLLVFRSKAWWNILMKHHVY